ncbi:Hypothetical predicted protein, partial [Pelobates cultripes]
MNPYEDLRSSTAHLLLYLGLYELLHALIIDWAIPCSTPGAPNERQQLTAFRLPAWRL